MLTDASEALSARPSAAYVHVDDVDATYQAAARGRDTQVIETMPPEELSEGRHALTLQRLAVTVKLTNNHLAADE